MAAAVWAWTEPRQGSRSGDFDEKSSRFTIDGLARQGIRGLTTKDTVRKYRNLWQEAIDRELGYQSFDSYCRDRKIPLAKDEIPGAIAAMREAGMGVPAISSATGIPEQTIRDRSPGRANGNRYAEQVNQEPAG